MHTEDEADEEREAMSGGDELGNLPGLIDARGRESLPILESYATYHVRAD